MTDWLLRHARLFDIPDLVDVAIADGKISAIGPDLPLPAEQNWDLGGRVLMPGLIDAHTHLDKCYISAPNRSGTLVEAIQVWRSVKTTRDAAEFRRVARRALESAILNGVTALRSHVDLERHSDLVAAEALLEVRAALRDQIDVQLVGLGCAAGSAENQATLEAGMRLGLDMVGGAPALHPNATEIIDATFALAERLGKPVDLHIDETEDPAMLTLATVADRTRAHGMAGQVVAGHCCSLAFVDGPTLRRVIDSVAVAGVHIVTLPLCNLVLMGRGMHPAPRGITRVKELLGAGVPVSAASDNVHDPFNPFGSHDLLQIAGLTAATAHMTGENDLRACVEMVTTHPAQLWGYADYGIRVGAPADLVVLDSTRPLDAVTAPPLRLATFKRGKLIVRTHIERSWGSP